MKTKAAAGSKQAAAKKANISEATAAQIRGKAASAVG